ncbi:MAG: hypothetical protein OXI96_00425 [Acidimicrobiaceae bacterium]|nr:hypothetical protein [Acidimicrobiaceae bacterium]
MIVAVQLEPVDTLFLRDGTPFAAGSAPQEDVGSLFPPYPPTMVGALRAALARCNGWNNGKRWPKRLNTVLGDGPHDLGALKFDGPIVLQDGEPLFPVPRHVLGAEYDGEWRPIACLRPGSDVMCDLGATVRLPELPRDSGSDVKLKSAPDRWLTKTGLETVLHGKLPGDNEIVPSRKLWRLEQRVGLEIDKNTHTAREGRLYSTRHVRTMRGVSLGMRIDGVPENDRTENDWTLPHGCLGPLGGESRVVEYRSWDAAKLEIDAPLGEIDTAERVAIVALTPLDLDKAVVHGRIPLENAGGLQVVSACLDRPRRVGGWDSLARRPLSLRSLLPAGSVLFCEADNSRHLARTAKTGGGLLKIGLRTEWGFGLTAVGAWSNE